jgi:hypothetical protein
LPLAQQVSHSVHAAARGGLRGSAGAPGRVARGLRRWVLAHAPGLRAAGASRVDEREQARKGAPVRAQRIRERTAIRAAHPLRAIGAAATIARPASAASDQSARVLAGSGRPPACRLASPGRTSVTRSKHDGDPDSRPQLQIAKKCSLELSRFRESERSDRPVRAHACEEWASQMRCVAASPVHGRMARGASSPVSPGIALLAISRLGQSRGQRVESSSRTPARSAPSRSASVRSAPRKSAPCR